MSYDFDLFVIGGGSGGVRAGRLAAAAGKRVGLAEEYRMGGTCVIRGCVPKKLMVYASEFSETFEDAAGFGWSVGETSFDWARLIAAKDAEITRLEGLYAKNLGGAGAQIFAARATLQDKHTVRLSTGEVLTANHILIATGGTPYVPEFPGSDLCITSNDIFHLAEQPARVLVVGGGYIACEFAGILNGMGSHVTQFYRSEQVLRGFDREVRDFVADAMRARGIDVQVNTDIASVQETDDGLKVTRKDGETLVVDQVLMATGRAPNSADLGLEAAGVETGRKGEILVDSYSRTNVENIWAVGDVTDRMALTPVAIREGAAVVDTLIHGKPTQPDHDLIATAVFTQPEIGTVGIAEEDADEPVEVYTATFRPMKHILAGRDEKMLMKLIVSVATRKVLGCHVVGHAAGEMIQMAGVAIKMGATKEDFDRTVAVHPTAAEELVTMKSPSRVVGG